MAALVVALGFAAALVADYPGHFTYDAVWQLAQGRAGVFDDWHPPVMAWLLGLADRIRPGAWPFVVADGALFYGGLLAFVALEPNPRPICLPLLAVWMISPIVLIYQGVVVKDVLFANACVAGFAALAWAGRLWPRRTARWALLVLAFALLGLAGLTRQNGLAAPLCGAAALAVIALTRPAPAGAAKGRVGRSLAWGAAALVLVLALAGVATWGLEAHGDHKPQTARHLKVLQVYDLAGVIRRDPTLPLPILERRQPGLARFLRRSAAPIYRSSAVDNIVMLPGADIVMNADADSLTRQWVSMIVNRPWLYLGIRAEVWRTTLLTPASAQCPMVFTGVDGGEPAYLRGSGLKARDDDKDDWDSDYAGAFLGSPLYSHAFHGGLLIVVMAAGLQRWRRGDRDPGLIAALGLGAAAVLVTASFFVVSIACDYRFLYVLDAAAMAISAREAAARWGRVGGRSVRAVGGAVEPAEAPPALRDSAAREES
jgi:hypothetical protein